MKSNTTVAAAKPVVTPKPASSKPAAPKKAEPKSAPAPKPEVKALVPATAVAAAKPKPAAEPKPQKYAKATMSIPNASPDTDTDNETTQDFRKTLKQEKSKLKHLTVADLRYDQSDIYFSHNWKSKDLMAIPERAWWQKRASIFADAMHIVSVHGDTEIRMVIGDYNGPGTYSIKKATVVSRSDDLDADELESGQIKVESDNGRWISGSFHFAVSDGNGRQLAFDHGAFRLSTKDQLPRF